jgi:alpha,alpha-trehalase
MSNWSLVFDEFDPPMEQLREALCVLANGKFATRGAAAEAVADDFHYPATYIAGGYNRLKSDVAGRTIENEDLVNVPNWLPLTFRIEDGPWFDLHQVEILSFRQELDIRRGVLLRDMRFRDESGRRTELHDRRFVHMGYPHLAALQTKIVAENWSGRMEVRSGLDGRVVNAGVARYRDLSNQHLTPLETGTERDTMWIKVQTSQSEIRIAQAARTCVMIDGREEHPARQSVEEPGWVAQEFAVDIAEGKGATIEKVVALYTSRDRAISECGLAARTAVDRAGGFDELLVSQIEAWDYLWDQSDIVIETGPAQKTEHTIATLRLHVFHLLQTVSPNILDLDVGVPARGLHGEGYRGHIFWDELFIFPFLNLRLPEVTRGLLRYRYRRLGEARAAAREAGYRGAMYPWQSGSDGREESQRLHLNPISGRWIPDNTYLQRHINAAIAFNVWQHYQATDDMNFLSFFGAEMILELARFWGSIATYNAELDRYEILGVMGPDEYHDAYPDANEGGLANNAYTNVMAVWVLCRAIEVLEILPADQRKRLSEKLHLTRKECAHWDEVSRKMRVVFHDDGIISQFEGYDRLEELDWEGLRKKYGDIRRLDRILEAENDTPNRYKASKQADVLMLFYLFSSDELRELFERLGYPFEYETIPKNIDYYLARTSEGSSLSRVVHSWVLARGDRAASWRLFCNALETDIGDNRNGTTHEGVHLGAMAGTVDVIQRCYTGIETRGDVLYLHPSLPSELDRMRLRVRFRGNTLGLDVNAKRITITVERCGADAVKVAVRDRVHELKAGEIMEFTF